jgi:hypothetical protein
MEDLALEEQQDAMLMEVVMVQNLGFISMEHFVKFRGEAIMGMMRFGNEFLNGLGIALKFADIKDAIKLIQVWYNDVSQHQMLEQIYQAKEKATKESNSGLIITR